MRLRDSIAALALGVALALPAAATDVTVVGLSSARASVSINGSSPRWLGVGQRSPEWVKTVKPELLTSPLIKTYGDTAPPAN